MTARFRAQETERIIVPLTKVGVEVVTGGSSTKLATVRTRGAGRHLVIFFRCRKWVSRKQVNERIQIIEGKSGPKRKRIRQRENSMYKKPVGGGIMARYEPKRRLQRMEQKEPSSRVQTS